MAYVFYDINRVVFGKSKIMYRRKWYLLLYATQDYVIIRLRNKYTKLDKYDVEDCTYNNTVIDEHDGCIRMRTRAEMLEVIREGQDVLATQYDLDAIEACKQDMELYYSKELTLFFLSGMLTNVKATNGNTEAEQRFRQFVVGVSRLGNSTQRKGINKLITRCFDKDYSTINFIMRKHGIMCDSDSMLCLQYKFVMDLLYVIEGGF